MKSAPEAVMIILVAQAVRELGETGGSNIRTIEKFISSSYDVELDEVSQYLMVK